MVRAEFQNLNHSAVRRIVRMLLDSQDLVVLGSTLRYMRIIKPEITSHYQLLISKIVILLMAFAVFLLAQTKLDGRIDKLTKVLVGPK